MTRDEYNSSHQGLFPALSFKQAKLRKLLKPRMMVLTWALVAALGSSVLMETAHAARLGHARVLSAQGAPLQIVAPLLDLTSDEAANPQVSLADAAAWQQAGLTPPTPLADTRATLETGPNGSRMVRITSSQPATSDVIDVLLTLRSNAGQRQLQVTVLAPSGNAAVSVQPAAAGRVAGGPPVGAASSDAASGQITVQPGQTLWDIASNRAVPNATIYQDLAAVWQANPQAFIQNNMNLVRSGASLDLPDAATVRAIDPEAARRLFVEQAEAFQRYRGRLGEQGSAAAPDHSGGESVINLSGVTRAGSVSASDHNGESGKVESGQAEQKAGSASADQDHLRLSSSSGADAKADADTSTQHAIQDANKRVDELQANVQALNEAVAAASGGAASGGQGNANQSNSGGTPSPGEGASASNGGGSIIANGGQGNGATAAGVGPIAIAGQSASAANGALTASGGQGNNTVAAPGSEAIPGASGGASATGLNSPMAAALGIAKDTTKDAVAKIGMSSWLSDNLMAIIAGVLVVVIVIVAWMLRRVGQIRKEDEEASNRYAKDPLIDSKLSGIDLDLDKPIVADASDPSKPSVDPLSADNPPARHSPADEIVAHG